MLKMFLFAFAIYVALQFLQLTVLAVITLISGESLKETIEIEPLSMLLSATLFTVFGGLFLWLILHFTATNTMWIIIVCILFLSLLPTYSFFVEPLKFLYSPKRYKREPQLEKMLKARGFDYHIRSFKGKVNAYATGVLPSTKTILVSSELKEGVSVDALESLLLHEVGHHQKNHMAKLYIINLVGMSLFFLAILLRQKVEVLNSSPTMEIVSLLLVVGMMSFILFSLIPSKVQYRLEFQADAVAASVVGSERVVLALKELDQLSDGGVSKGGMTHPTLQKRAEALNNLNVS